MIKFEDIHPNIVPVLKEHGIKETDLFNHYSDLYIGCPDWNTARKIQTAGVWSAMSSIFKPQKGSEMDMYPQAVDIAFGCTTHDIKTRYNKKTQSV